MSESTIWWLLAGSAVAIELLIGTFYLLMISVGFAAGAIAAHLGLGMTAQIAIAALVGGGAVVVWEKIRNKNPPELPFQSNPNVNMDIGQTVHVTHWNTDGTASVRFRGAQWTAVTAFPAEASLVGDFRIRQVVGSRLFIEKMGNL